MSKPATPAAGRVMMSAPGPQTVIDGRPYLYFAGTGYLGLQGRAEVIEAAAEAARQFGMHSATSRGGFGNQPPTLYVERLAAEWLGAEAAFYFVSGYVGGQVLLAALAGQFDAAYIEEHAHYSIHEAVRLSGLATHEFRHCDAGHLAELLRGSPPGTRPLVISDGVFPISGRIAPAGEYVQALAPYVGSALMLDDAHALGVLGENGRGTFEHHNLWQRGVNGDGAGKGPRLFMYGTLSKAVGGGGGIVAGSRGFIERLKAASRWFDAASGPPAPVAGGTAVALRIVLAEPALRQRLHANARRLKAGLRAMGLAATDEPTPVAAIVRGDAPGMVRVQESLMERGIAIGYFRTYSAVGREGALRIAVFANHTDEMIDRLLTELAAVL